MDEFQDVDPVQAEHAVRFMNVHKSKGLEGNIVIVADRSGNVTTEKEENVRYRVKEDNKVEYFYYGCIRNSDNPYGRKYSGFQAGAPVWKYAVEERAKGSIVIVDYKSDSKKVDWTEEDFEKHLQKYDGQLKLYQYAMAKLFSVTVGKVETRLYPIARRE